MPSSPESDGGGQRVEQPAHEQEDQREEQHSREAQLTAELARMDDRYKRALADLDNYRKRSAREVERRVAESREQVLRDWLETVDSVERALRMEPQGPVFDGLRAVLDQMESVLARQGVRRIGRPGEQFDPERHDAVDARASDEVPDHEVLDVVRSGFALGDRIMRPAQVVVSRRPERQP